MKLCAHYTCHVTTLAQSEVYVDNMYQFCHSSICHYTQLKWKYLDCHETAASYQMSIFEGVAESRSVSEGYQIQSCLTLSMILEFCLHWTIKSTAEADIMIAVERRVFIFYRIQRRESNYLAVWTLKCKWALMIMRCVWMLKGHSSCRGLSINLYPDNHWLTHILQQGCCSAAGYGGYKHSI